MDENSDYKYWLDELNSIREEDFFSTFRQFLVLLERENPEKVEALRQEMAKEELKLSRLADKAIDQMEELIHRVEEEAHKEKVDSLPHIDEYKKIKSGQVITTEPLPNKLYHALRLTIEFYRPRGKFKAFDYLMSQKDNFWYLDYMKFCKAYPAYKDYREAYYAFEKKREEEIWGVYRYLKWATTFFQNVTPKEAGGWVKSKIMSKLRRLILYLSTPSQEGKYITKRATKPRKRELRKKIKNIVRNSKFGRKEKLLLECLSKDFEPKTKEEIASATESKAVTKLISTVRKKLKNTEFGIKTRSGSYSSKTTYQLKNSS